MQDTTTSITALDQAWREGWSAGYDAAITAIATGEAVTLPPVTAETVFDRKPKEKR